MIGVIFILSFVVGNILVREDLILDKFLGGSKKELFRAYHHVYKKQYDINSEEALKRYKVFKNNLKFIDAHNERNEEFKMKIGPFTDMDDNEFRDKVLMKKEVVERYFNEKSNIEIEEDDDIHLKINWKDKFGPIAHQRYCGSCWAFSTLSVIEASYNIQYNNLLYLSREQLLSCDSFDDACNGGWPSGALVYLINNGIESEVNIPYQSGFTHTRSLCKKTGKEIHIVEGFKTCAWGTCNLRRIKRMLKNGPIIALIDSSSASFRNYGRGILSLNECKQANHAIAIIGIDIDKVGEYLIGRNSWGEAWGEAGYFRIRINESNKTCMITAAAWTPIVTNKYKKPECPTIYTEEDFKGIKYEMCESIRKVNTDIINYKSIKINKSKVLFFNSYNCSGKSLEINKDMNKLSNDFNLFIPKLSISIIEDLPPMNCIWVYQHCCNNGFKHEICNDISDLALYGMESDISSIIFGKGVGSVELYSRKDFEVRKDKERIRIGENNYCIDILDNIIFNKKVNSIKIIRHK